jgi:Dyp-type peroxidase family
MLSRTPVLQQGIYHSRSDHPRNSFSIVFLRVREPCHPEEIQRSMVKLWRTYNKLQNSLSRRSELGSDVSPSVLIGYGPRFFEINGIGKRKPTHLDDRRLFLQAKVGGSPIVPNVGLSYAEDITSNQIAEDHIVIQFVGETQEATHRAVIETWRILKENEADLSQAPLIMRSFYTGFNRPDGRNWLGFHDGVSNIRSSERLRYIQISKEGVNPNDHWTINGTYMAFLRISIDLTIWEKIPIKEQERIIGRSKFSGCPLVSVDKNDNNIFASGCPVHGTLEITEKGNERFRQYVPLNQRRSVAGNFTDPQTSHVARMRSTSARIFRQGYEFLESTDNLPYFRVGLNFVSFQSGTDKIYKLIEKGFSGVNLGGPKLKASPNNVRDKLISIRGAGIFLVPPHRREEIFPGQTIFTKENVTRSYHARLYR